MLLKLNLKQKLNENIASMGEKNNIKMTKKKAQTKMKKKKQLGTKKSQKKKKTTQKWSMALLGFRTMQSRWLCGLID